MKRRTMFVGWSHAARQARNLLTRVFLTPAGERRQEFAAQLHLSRIRTCPADRQSITVKTLASANCQVIEAQPLRLIDALPGQAKLGRRPHGPPRGRRLFNFRPCFTSASEACPVCLRDVVDRSSQMPERNPNLPRCPRPAADAETINRPPPSSWGRLAGSPDSAAVSLHSSGGHR